MCKFSIAVNDPYIIKKFLFFYLFIKNFNEKILEEISLYATYYYIEYNSIIEKIDEDQYKYLINFTKEYCNKQDKLNIQKLLQNE